MRRFPKCKITVLKTANYEDLATEYRRPDVRKGPCPFFKVGDEFEVDYLAVRPENFECDWAWDDIHKIVFSMMVGADFGTWMQNPDTFIACCTDGIKPVSFKIERLTEQA